MSLRDRSRDIRQRFNVSISPSTLLNLYKKNNIRFKTVDVNSVMKTTQL